MSNNIAIDLDMDLQVVQRVKQTCREIGEVCRSRQYKGRAPIMSPGEIDVCPTFLVISCVVHLSISLQFMLALLDHSLDIYLDMICQGHCSGRLLEPSNLQPVMSKVLATLTPRQLDDIDPGGQQWTL